MVSAAPAETRAGVTLPADRDDGVNVLELAPKPRLPSRQKFLHPQELE